MSREDIQKLLGGYATGTLTPEEQQALFEAALEDQELFDALAREQSLRDLLQDPGARAHLLAALDDRPLPWYRRRWLMPAVYAMPALIGIVVLGITLRNAQAPKAEQPALVAALKEAPPPPPANAEPLPPAPQQPAAPRQQAAAPLASRAPQPAPAPARENRQTTEIAAAPPQPAAAPAPPAPVLTAEKAEESVRNAETKKAADAVEATNRIAVRAEAGAAGGAGSGGVLGGIVGGVPSGTQDFSKGVTQASQSARTLFYDAPQAQQAVLALQNKVSGPAQNSQNQQNNARRAMNAPGAFAPTTGAAAATSNLGVRYSILRKESGGEFVQVDAAALKTGDVIELRFVTNGAGYLSVRTPQPGGGTRTVYSTATVPLATYTTPPLDPGVTRVQVGFTPQQRPVGVITSLNFVETANDSSTYVVAPRGDVAFTIDLTYR
jgi:hypothetical protein